MFTEISNYIPGGERYDDWKLIALVTAGLVGYELLNRIENHPFDYRDVIATLIFGGLSSFLYFYLLRKDRKLKGKVN